MGSLWALPKDENNQRTLGWLGAAVAVASRGVWALVTYYWAHDDVEPASQFLHFCRKLNCNGIGFAPQCLRQSNIK
jgi:hypothetical protein